MTDADHMHDGEPEVEAALAKITAGARYFVKIARQRTAVALEMLDRGDFMQAANYFGYAQQAVSGLAYAQGNVGVAGGAILTNAKDLKVGDVLADIGEITEVEVNHCEGAIKCPGHVKVKFGGDHELLFLGHQDAFVVAEAGSSDFPDAPPDWMTG